MYWQQPGTMELVPREELQQVRAPQVLQAAAQSPQHCCANRSQLTTPNDCEQDSLSDNGHNGIFSVIIRQPLMQANHIP